MAKEHRTRAARLLHALLDSGAFTPNQLADELLIPDETLDRFLDETQRISPERQLLIAVLALRRAPALQREALQLRAQATAALQFEFKYSTKHWGAEANPS